MKRIAIAVVTMLMAGCTSYLGQTNSFPGSVELKHSEFDGSTHITQTPGWTGGIERVKMGLSWNSKMQKDEIRLDALAADSGDIAAGKSLHINIDGEITDLASYDEKTIVIVQPPFSNQFITTTGAVWYGKSYIVQPQLVEKMISGKKVAWRLDLRKDYKEGALTDGPSTAISGFRPFLESYRGIQKSP